MSDAAGPAYLLLEGAEERRIEITPERACGIGRSDANLVVLNDDMASRNHALIRASRGGGVFLLTDLGSTNGTLLNGTRVTTPMELQEGDRIQIGDQRMVFHQVLTETPATEADQQKSTSVQVRMGTITVLVVDIRDFTGMTQRIGSEKLGEVSAHFNREAGRMLQLRGAWTQKYIGDAIMAVWMHEKKAEVSDLLPVLKALAELRDLAGSLSARFRLGEPVRIGSGINTGVGYTGNFGSNAASDHTAMGETVNKTFRIESSTKEIGYDLAIGADVFAILSSRPGIKGLLSPSVTRLKGYDEPETVYGARLSALEDLLKKMSNSA